MLTEAKSPQQLIELPIEAIDRVLTRLQQILFGFGPNADAEKFVGALDDLQWLSKIMAGDREEHGLKIGGPLWVCFACHSQGYWLLGRHMRNRNPTIRILRYDLACRFGLAEACQLQIGRQVS
jgi:hypothetical protein